MCSQPCMVQHGSYMCVCSVLACMQFTLASGKAPMLQTPPATLPPTCIAALGPNNSFAHQLDMSGCGACFEVQCGQGNGTSAQVGCTAVTTCGLQQ